MTRPDAAVVGAGIIGAACAWRLRRAGLRVVVVEPDIVGGGTTAACMGHLTVMDDSEAQFALTSYSVRLWREIAADLPREAEWLPCGTLWLAADEEEMAEVRRKFAYYSARGVEVEILDAARLREAEPNVRPGLAGALRVPRDAVIYPPAAARWLLRGIEIVRGHAEALFDGGVRLTDGRILHAGVVVNATGALAPRLTPSLDIHPRKGHLLITDRYPGFARHQLVELGYLKSAHGSRADSVAFNVQPRVTGQLLIGSSRQIGVHDRAVEPAMLGRMLRRAVEYMPSIGSLDGIRSWTGLRPCTPDNLPFIGLAPGARSVYAAAGHEGLGVTTATGTAELIACAITGTPPPLPASPYLPGRDAAHHD